MGSIVQVTARFAAAGSSGAGAGAATIVVGKREVMARIAKSDQALDFIVGLVCLIEYLISSYVHA